MDWNWPEDQDNFGDHDDLGGVGDLGDAETADLAGDPDWRSAEDELPELPDEASETGEAGTPPAGPAFAAVDAHVDEPLGGDEPADPDWTAGGPAETVFGAAEPAAADGWAEPQFPPSLELPDLPDPVDGPPWSDAALLGAAPVPDLAETGGADPAALAEYAGLGDGGTDPWAALLASDDPATSALARWWGPAT